MTNLDKQGELKKLDELYEKGVLTKAELAKHKIKILSEESSILDGTSTNGSKATYNKSYVVLISIVGIILNFFTKGLILLVCPIILLIVRYLYPNNLYVKPLFKVWGYILVIVIISLLIFVFTGKMASM